MLPWFQDYSDDAVAARDVVAMVSGLVTTLSLPVTSGGEFEGVVALDVSMGDLLDEIDYYHDDVRSYAFVTNRDG